jgi:hypothetical protein
MRRTVFQLLRGTPALTAIVPTDRWKQAGNVVDVPEFPFVVLRWLAPVAGNARGTFMRQLRVELYEARGSYAKADAFLGNQHTGSGVYGVLSGLTDYVGVDGRVTETRYLGDSGDQESPEFKSNMKFSSWRMIGVDL